MKVFPDHENGNTLAVLKRTLYAVEATSFEQQTLWEQHAIGSLRPKYTPIKWVQINPGWLEDVGNLGACKCFIQLTWAEIDGQLILFWHPCSPVSDSRKNEVWFMNHFKKKWDNGTRWAMGDAQNFGHCLAAIKEANGASKD